MLTSNILSIENTMWQREHTSWSWWRAVPGCMGSGLVICCLLLSKYVWYHGFMARPLRIEYEGAVYHVTSRGNERKPIFVDDNDRLLFLETLESAMHKNNWTKKSNIIRLFNSKNKIKNTLLVYVLRLNGSWVCLRSAEDWRYGNMRSLSKEG